jgi:hypothetical protein
MSGRGQPFIYDLAACPLCILRCPVAQLRFRAQRARDGGLPKASAESVSLCDYIFPCQSMDRGSFARWFTLLSRFQRYRFFLRLPRAARWAETGPSLALSFLDIAPLALNPERRGHKWPNSSPSEAAPQTGEAYPAV